MLQISLTDRLAMVTLGLVERFDIAALEDTLFRARIAMRTEATHRADHAAIVRSTQQQLDKAIQQITRHQIQAVARGSDFSPYLLELETMVSAGQKPIVPQPLWEKISYADINCRPRLDRLTPSLIFSDAFGRAAPGLVLSSNALISR